ncbi:uncharacterized protein LOC128189849 isoform X1 [Crassostrea angulata]|uniref:uncharacterized protein LOC128189849 isoform X1 n=1 Tax=Magallana angulata TaxID=2784310 RepID=UPI0022B2142F|nr:uncharacterized protein LOC128189849 isoform X1 [Crassostrea angulata]
MRLKAPCLILLFYIKSVDLCTLDSGRCCHNYFRKNGICKECPPGTFGTDCSSKCPSGFFGKFCRQECLCNAHDCNSTYGCALTIGSPRSDYFIETTPLITLPTTSPLPWMSTTFVFVGFTAVLTVVLALYVLRTRTIQSKRGNGNTEETLVSYEVTNSQDIDNEVQENNVNVLRVQHNHRISTAVPQLLKRCTSYKVYNRSWAEEAAVSVERESKCEQDEYDECKPVDERSINDNLISDKPRKARSTQYKTVDKARVYPGSKLRPYSSVKHNRYSKNGRKNSQERGRETVCESSDLYDDAFSKIKGNDYEDIGLVSRYEASNSEDKSDEDCLTESNISLTEEEEDTMSKDKDKNIVPLRKTDEGATENIYTSLDLNKCDKLDVNEYETERSACYENESEPNECTNHENQEKWSDGCSNCVLSLNGNASFDASNKEDIEKDSNGIRFYEDII